MLTFCQVHLGVPGRKQRFLPLWRLLSQGTRQVIKGKYSKYSVSEAIACWKLCKEEARPQSTRDGQLGCPRQEGDKHPSAGGQGHGEVTRAKSWRRGRQAERVCRKHGNSQSRSPEAGRCLAGLRTSRGPRAWRRGEEDHAREGCSAGMSTTGLWGHVSPCLLLSVADGC